MRDIQVAFREPPKFWEHLKKRCNNQERCVISYLTNVVIQVDVIWSYLKTNRIIDFDEHYSPFFDCADECMNRIQQHYHEPLQGIVKEFMKKVWIYLYVFQVFLNTDIVCEHEIYAPEE
jgi:hypothetical protein